MKKLFYLINMLGLIFLGFACGSQKSTEEKAEESLPEATAETAETTESEISGRVYFVEPDDGATVTSPVHVVMGVEGMEIQPAGELNVGMGHHHVLINDGFTEEGVVVPADETHIHFGKGQTETDLELAPGEYTLTLQFANGLHQSYGEPWSASIKVIVE